MKQLVYDIAEQTDDDDDDDDDDDNNNNNNLPLIWLRQTARPNTCYTTYNSLPRRTATIYM